MVRHRMQAGEHAPAAQVVPVPRSKSSGRTLKSGAGSSARDPLNHHPKAKPLSTSTFSMGPDAPAPLASSTAPAQLRGSKRQPVSRGSPQGSTGSGSQSQRGNARPFGAAASKTGVGVDDEARVRARYPTGQALLPTRDQPSPDAMASAGRQQPLGGRKPLGRGGLAGPSSSGRVASTRTGLR